MKLRLGIDLGGTKTALGLVNEQGQILKRHRFPSFASDFDSYAKTLVAEIKTFLKASDTEDIQGIGVGCAGQIQLGTGLIHHSPNLNWNNAPLGECLRNAFPGCWVKIDNDVRAATVGEYLHGLNERPLTYVNMFLGTGIGSGIVMFGRILRGAANSAGEIGHTTIHKDGPKGPTTGFGIYEYYGSGNALGRLGQAWYQKNPEGHPLTRFGVQSPSEVTGRMIGELAEEGDAEAMRIVRRVARDAGIGMANVINFLNPHVITYGGGMADLGILVERPLMQSLKEHAIPTALARTRILKAKLGQDAGIIGSAFLNKLDADGRFV